MRNTSWLRATLASLLLASLGAVLGGCASDPSLVDTTTGRLTIQAVPPGIDAPWVLALPGGGTEEGTGDAVLQAMPFGEYTITWGAVEGWNAPSPNVMSGTHQSPTYLIFTGFYSKADDTKGTIVIDPDPDVVAIPWSLTGPAGYSREGAGDATINDLDAGTYEITWEDVAGYTQPDPESAVLAEGETVTFSVTYFQRDIPLGDLRVDVEPDGIGASWSINGNLGMTFAGVGDTTFSQIPIGQYIITWHSVEGWRSPVQNPATIYVVTDGLVTFEGLYTEIETPTGTVTIDPNPNSISATWTLAGPNRYTAHGSGDQQLAGREVGEYTITWNDVADHDTPAPQTGTLQAGAVLSFSADYVQQTGSIRLDPEPNSINAPWTLSGPNGSFNGSGDRTYDALPVGTYTVQWRSVSGWTTPSPSTRIVSLSADETRTVTGTYEEIPPATGSVSVDPRPAGITASWRLRGPDGFDRSGSSARTYSDVPAGSYSITWNAIPDWRTPVPDQVTQTLGAGQAIAFVGTYGQLDGPSIQPVTSALVHGNTLTLSGSGFGSNPLQGSNGVGTTGWIERNAVGAEMNNLSNAPGWDRAEASAPVVITTQRVHSGQKAVLGRVDFAADSNWQAGLRYRHSSVFDRIYVTFWIYWDPINLSPHRSTQWKLWRINHNGTVTDQAGQIYFSSRHNSGGSLYDYQWVAHCALGCTGVDYDHCYQEALPIPYYAPRFGNPAEYVFLNKADSRPWTEAHPQARAWNRVEIYIDRGAVDTFTGSLSYSILRPGQGKVFEELMTQLKLWRSDSSCRNPQDPWRYFQVQNYWDDDGSNGAPMFTGERADFFFDDIYLQFGTQARVEMGDRPVYDDCTRLEIQPPTSWGDGSIALTVNRGSFASGSTVYLFVVRDDGSVSPGVQATVQ